MNHLNNYKLSAYIYIYMCVCMYIYIYMYISPLCYCLSLIHF